MKWAFVLLAALPLLAEDPWASKPVSQLDDKQLNRLLNDSPWSKDASVSMEGNYGGASTMPSGGGSGRRGSRGGAGASAGVPSASEGSMGAPLGGNEPGGGMGGAPAPFVPRVLIRWQSAKPILECVNDKGSAAILAKLAETNYIIMVGGISLGARPGPDGVVPDQERVAQLKKKLIEMTVLKRKGHEPLHPAGVQQSANGLVFFLFPRTDPIDLDDKEITFESASGPMKMKAKFALNKMMYQGQLAL